ncbi:hypothetical protein G6F59_014166 [Rhizopus arrhizus]|nr:hypothetical protein G6F59_014166 [Rhizopus arrhizus]
MQIPPRPSSDLRTLLQACRQLRLRRRGTAGLAHLLVQQVLEAGTVLLGAGGVGVGEVVGNHRHAHLLRIQSGFRDPQCLVHLRCPVWWNRPRDAALGSGCASGVPAPRSGGAGIPSAAQAQQAVGAARVVVAVLDHLHLHFVLALQLDHLHQCTGGIDVAAFQLAAVHGGALRGCERLLWVGVAEQAIEAALEALVRGLHDLDPADLGHGLRAFALRDDRDRAVGADLHRLVTSWPFGVTDNAAPRV